MISLKKTVTRRKKNKTNRISGDPRFKGGEFVFLPGSGQIKDLKFLCAIIDIADNFNYRVMWLCDTPMWKFGETDLATISHIDKVAEIV
jgi:hypothetical protein